MVCDEGRRSGDRLMAEMNQVVVVLYLHWNHIPLWFTSDNNKHRLKITEPSKTKSKEWTAYLIYISVKTLSIVYTIFTYLSLNANYVDSANRLVHSGLDKREGKLMRHI